MEALRYPARYQPGDTGETIADVAKKRGGKGAVLCRIILWQHGVPVRRKSAVCSGRTCKSVWELSDKRVGVVTYLTSPRRVAKFQEMAAPFRDVVREVKRASLSA